MNPLIADSAASALKSTDGHPTTVLVVDDEPMICDLLRWILAQLGYNVMSAADSAEALEIAPRIESLQILITDLSLEGMSGVELAGELRAARPELKTVFISGWSREQFEDLGADMSQSAFVSKPFSLRQVSEAIRALAEPESLVSIRS
jgi:DNA-binding response OmpR family regulator